MFLQYDTLRSILRKAINDKERQGVEVAGVREELAALPDSYDVLDAFAHRLAELPLRPDWPYVEPIRWDEVEAEMAPMRLVGRPLEPIDLGRAAERAKAGFVGSVIGCILGKPLEVSPSLAELEAAGAAVGEWPLNDYVTVDFLEALGRRHNSWAETTRGHIHYVAADDDLHYDVLGMLALERYGLDLTRDGVRRTWEEHQGLSWVFGPERTIFARMALARLAYNRDDYSEDVYDEWAAVWNPGDELCGAAIRADAYGYATPGRPDLAAKLAFADASLTHNRTGVYATMYIAAAIASMYCVSQPIEAFEIASQYIPQRSRFAESVFSCLEMVRTRGSWLGTYMAIHAAYGDYGHCQVLQEVGTLINTLHHAADVGHGVCLQVMQGNDTDSFGATAGSLLGVWFGLEGIEDRWVDPFNDEIRFGLSSFYEHSLSALVKRMGELPGRLAPSPARL